MVSCYRAAVRLVTWFIITVCIKLYMVSRCSDRQSSGPSARKKPMGSSHLVGWPQHWRSSEVSLHLLHTLHYST